MNPCDKRWATTYDLKHYFKINDLLGGLTELQYQQLRSNIGVLKVGEGGLSEPEQLPYSNLKHAIQTETLITGGRYIISDFLSIYENDYGIWGTDESDYPSSVYTLIVTAVAKNKIDPRVIVVGHDDWIVEYDPTSELLSDGTYTKGKITYMRDGNNNSAYYDFKNIRFRRSGDQIKAITRVEYLDCYTFSDLVLGLIVDASETLTNTRNNVLNSSDNVFFGDTYNNIIQTDCEGNTFLKGCNNVELLWDSRNNIFEEKVCYATGSISNRHIKLSNTILSTTVTKQIHVVNSQHLVTYLDTTTYAQQIELL